MAKGEETRTAILRRATELASVVGLESLTIGTLAEAMGMSKSGVFAHFRSKDALDVAVVGFVRERFVDEVVRPAFKARRGVARVERLLERMHLWISGDFLPGGCPLLAASFELDDREGATRDLVVETQRDLLATLAQVARVAVDEGEFRPELDVDQFAFEVHGAFVSAHVTGRLLRDPNSGSRYRTAVARLVDAARTDRRNAV